MVYTNDIKRKARELQRIFRNLEIHIDGRRKAVYVNGVYFSFQEFWELNIDKIKHPSFWGV